MTPLSSANINTNTDAGELTVEELLAIKQKALRHNLETSMAGPPANPPVQEGRMAKSKHPTNIDEDWEEPEIVDGVLVLGKQSSTFIDYMPEKSLVEKDEEGWTRIN